MCKYRKSSKYGTKYVQCTEFIWICTHSLIKCTLHWVHTHACTLCTCNLCMCPQSIVYFVFLRLFSRIKYAFGSLESKVWIIMHQSTIYNLSLSPFIYIVCIYRVSVWVLAMSSSNMFFSIMLWYTWVFHFILHRWTLKCLHIVLYNLNELFGTFAHTNEQILQNIYHKEYLSNEVMMKEGREESR